MTDDVEEISQEGLDRRAAEAVEAAAAAQAEQERVEAVEAALAAGAPVRMIGDKMYAMASDEYDAHQERMAQAGAEIAAARRVIQAKESLKIADSVALRAWQDGKTWPAEWAAWVSALRDIVQGRNTDLPPMPEYP